MNDCCCITNPNGGFCLPCFESEHDKCDGIPVSITVKTKPGREVPPESNQKGR